MIDFSFWRKPLYCEHIQNPKLAGKDCCVGNPVNPNQGNKLQIEVDVPSGSPFHLSFVRYYNSTSRMGAFGRGWQHTYDRSVQDDTSGLQRLALANRPDGKVYQFVYDGQAFVPDTDIADRLEQIAGGWRYTVAGGEETELYDTGGRLLSITSRVRLIQTLAYDAQGRLGSVTDPVGRVMTFGYDDQKRITTVSYLGSQYSYSYSTDGKNNLVTVTYPDEQLPARGRTYHYEHASFPNALTGITDENNQRFATFGYNANAGFANLTEHAGGAGRITITEMSATSAVVVDHIADSPSAVSETRRYVFSSVAGAPKLRSIEGLFFSNGPPCPACGPKTIDYDAFGFVSRLTDWNNNVTTYQRNDSQGRRDLETQRVEAFGTPNARTISTEWHPNIRQPLRRAEPLRMTTYVYNGDGGVSCGVMGDGVTLVPNVSCSVTVRATADSTGAGGFGASLVGLPRTSTYTYNANGSVLTIDGPRIDVSDVTTNTYYANDDPDPNKRGKVATVTNAAGHVTDVTSYNEHGQPLTVVDPNGVATTFTYDPRQRVKTRNTSGELTSYDYDGAGRLTRMTQPDGSYFSHQYDAAGRLTSTSDNLGNRVDYTLDLKGNRTLEQLFDATNQLVQKRSRVYSSLNRLSQELGAQNQVAEYTYDGQGNVRTVKDPLNRITTNQYDALNRLKQVTSPTPISAVTQYAYNGLDALTQVTDPRSLVTGYAVDGLGNLTQQASPDTGTTVNSYDAAGNLLTQTDAKSQVTTYAYDALNRVTLITFHDGSKQTYVYDQGSNGIGRLSSITERDPVDQVTSVTAYAYDQHGRVTSETRTVGGVQYVLAYAYDGFGRLSGLTYPSGRTVVYGFDGLGRVSQVTTTKPGDQPQTVVSGVTYHPFGGVKGYTLGNGQTYTRGIDLDGRIASYTLGAQAFAIGYDAASRISFISDVGVPANTNTYGYDELDRITSAVLPATPYAYSYDAVGNRTSKTSGSSSDTYAYSPSSNRIASITPSSGPVKSFVFDPNGSTTADGQNTYAYDVRGRMVQATSSIGATSYQVNALGQRIRKTNTLGDTVFHYDTQGKLIAETGPGGALKRELIYLGDIPVGVVQ